MGGTNLKEITAWTQVDGSGQKATAVVLTYDTEINGKEIKIKDFAVKERNISAAYTSRECAPGSQADSGNYIVLELDEKDLAASTLEMIGRGRDAKTHVKKAELEVCQKVDLQAISGAVISKFDYRKNDKAVDPVADKFQGFVFEVPGTDKKLAYNLFIPDRQEENDPLAQYPMVLFMHDMGSCSEDLTAALAQGNGAVVWASDEEQRKHPCFVLAPHYPDKTAEDDYTVTWEADATIELIKSLTETYPIDKKRIYGTGQSMGCMMLCELNLRNPKFFAASFLVAGQWNPETMAAAKDENLWALVSEGDIKAFPIMGECMERMEAAGEKVSRGSIDANAPIEEQNRIMKGIANEGNHLMFTWYEGDSILPEDMEKFPGAYHICTWRKAYTIDAVHDWMFAQRL